MDVRVDGTREDDAAARVDLVRRAHRVRLRQRHDDPVLDDDVCLARAVRRHHQAAAHGERAAHAVAPGTGWERRNSSSASASPSLECSGGRPWPMAASAAASAARWRGPSASPARVTSTTT